MGKYVDEADIPIIGPDPYPTDEKTKAIGYAEAKLESDVNEGSTINEPEDIHEMAANAYASYILATGPVAPADTYSGDFADDGSDSDSFAQELHNMYRSARDAIITADEDEGEGSTEHVQFGGSR